MEVNTKDLLKKYGFHLKKRLGQNFLVSKSIVGEIINSANLTKNDIIVEIGAGLGIVTCEVSKLVRKVYAIEIDKKLCSILRERLAPLKNIEIMEKNCLKVNFRNLLLNGTAPESDAQRSRVVSNLGDHVKVIGNLPYYIVTPIIFHLFEYINCFKVLILMVQKEVAERIVSAPGSKKYSPLSIAVQFRTIPEIVSLVPASEFIPEPKVDSCILKLQVRKKPLIDVLNEGLFFSIIRKSFNKRRKMIRNSLNISEKLFKNINIDSSKRPENLSIEDFGRIADFIYENKINC